MKKQDIQENAKHMEELKADLLDFDKEKTQVKDNLSKISKGGNVLSILKTDLNNAKDELEA